MRAGVVEDTRDDLGRAVVAAHRVEGDADHRTSQRRGVVARRRRRADRLRAAQPGGPGSSRSSGRRGAAASSRGSANTPRGRAGRSRGASDARPGGRARRVAWVHPWGSWAPCVVRGARFGTGGARDGSAVRADGGVYRETAAPVSPVGRPERLEGLEARVDVVVRVVVLALVERQTADGAQTRAIGPVERGDRLGERDRVADGRLEVELVVIGEAQRLRLVAVSSGRPRREVDRRAGTPPRARCRSASSAAAGSGRTRRRATSTVVRRRGCRDWSGSAGPGR